MSEKTVGCRPVRIYMAMEDGPLPRSIKQVLSVLRNEASHTYVETTAEADLIIFTEVRKIERGYDKDKSYAHLLLPGQPNPGLPENCTLVDMIDAVASLLDCIKRVSERIQPVVTKEEIPEVPLRPDALRILVIEDTPKHQVSAKTGLAGHKLTIVGGYEEAMKILGDEKFDVVLTDLLMPMSSRTLGNAFKLGELVPYGLLLKDEAAHQGAKWVAVVTDTGHHDHWVSAAFDHFSYPVQIDGAKVLMMHAPMTQNAGGEMVKDWATALDRLMKV